MEIEREKSIKALKILDLLHKKVMKINSNIEFYKYDIDHNEVIYLINKF